MTALEHQLQSLMNAVKKIPKRQKNSIDLMIDAKKELIEKIHQVVVQHKMLKTIEIMQIMGKSRTVVLQALRELKKQGRVKLIGSGNTIKWGNKND